VKKPILIVIAAIVLIVVIAVGYMGYQAIVNQPSTSPTPTPAPEVVTQETARDAAIMYIATNHMDIASLTSNISWTGGRQETGLVGSETYIYISGNWNVTITNPVIPDPIYTLTAVYTDTASHVTIAWAGTYHNETITQTGYDYIVP
jgi:uncharacterized protein (UPF0333 family)